MHLPYRGAVHEPGELFSGKAVLQSLAAAMEDIPGNPVVVIRDGIPGKVPVGQLPGIIGKKCKKNSLWVLREPQAGTCIQKR